MILRSEKREDIQAIYDVNKAAFYRQDKPIGFTEWDLVNKIRESTDFIAELSIVAELENKVVGHILYSPMTIGDNFNCLCLAPMAVLPEKQGLGIGSKLIEFSIEKAKKMGYTAIVVLGHKDYYPKFGFKPAGEYGIGINDDYHCEYLLALELTPNALLKASGNVKYCEAFYDDKGNLL